jgi:Tfp pilus assembly major pilin PilA
MFLFLLASLLPISANYTRKNNVLTLTTAISGSLKSLPLLLLVQNGDSSCNTITQGSLQSQVGCPLMASNDRHF